jgi:hypothetical protein
MVKKMSREGENNRPSLRWEEEEENETNSP